MGFKKTVDVFTAIISLRRNDAYESKYLPQCLEGIRNQKCPVKIREPYITPSYSGEWKPGELSYLEACTDRLNNAVDAFMKTKATHIYLADLDIELPDNMICELLMLDVDLSSGVYAYHNDRYAMMFGRMVPKHTPYHIIPRDYSYLRGMIKGSPEEWWGGGNGCLLVKRRVFEKFDRNYPPLRFTMPNKYASDIYFWYKVQKAGFSARVHGGLLCGHLDQHPLSSYF